MHEDAPDTSISDTDKKKLYFISLFGFQKKKKKINK